MRVERSLMSTSSGETGVDCDEATTLICALVDGASLEAAAAAAAVAVSELECESGIGAGDVYCKNIQSPTCVLVIFRG